MCWNSAWKYIVRFAKEVLIRDSLQFTGNEKPSEKWVIDWRRNDDQIDVKPTNLCQFDVDQLIIFLGR